MSLLNSAKIRRGLRLLKSRGPSWFFTSLISTLPVIPKLFRRSLILINQIPIEGPFLALGGVHRNQLWKERVRPIQKSLQISLKTSSISERKNESDGTVGSGVRALEIGTWFGKGSTELILNLMPKDAEVFQLILGLNMSGKEILVRIKRWIQSTTLLIKAQ